VSHATSTEQQNPLLDLSDPIAFDEILPEHVVPAIRRLLEETSSDLDHLERSAVPTWDGVAGPLDQFGERLNRAILVSYHLNSVKNTPALREAIRTIEPEYVPFSLRVGQSRAIYDAMNTLRASAEWPTLTVAQQRIVDTFLRRARHAGVALPDAERRRFSAIKEELTKLGTTFSNNVLDATKAFALDLTTREEVAGLPKSLLQLAAQAARDGGSPHATAEGGPWRILLNPPFSGPFLAYSERRDLRERVYRAVITRASAPPYDNSEILVRILTLREEMATLLGYASFAHFSLASKMAPGVEVVVEKMEELRRAAYEHAKEELAELQAFVAEETGSKDGALELWDVRFWVERLQKRELGFQDEDLRPYFPFPHVLDGMFRLGERLFGIQIRSAGSRTRVWHDDVRVYHVHSEHGEKIATFYLDVYSRPREKQGGAWQNGLINRRRTGPSDLDVRLPVAILVCNQSPPVGERPSLMSFNDVRTLFHEFGHTLHSLLTTVDYASASGTANVEWDAIELPSQFMENWCYDPGTLRAISRHIDTNEPLPDDLARRIAASRRFRAGSQLLNQLFYTLVDLELHGPSFHAATTDTATVVKSVASRTLLMPRLPEDRVLCAFNHIFAGGYPAGYYSYLWANIASADAFAAFEEVGLDDEDAVARMGHRFREVVLASGGARHPLEVFRAFRGREPEPTAFLRHLGLRG
jgi:oligopeptidase A